MPLLAAAKSLQSHSGLKNSSSVIKVLRVIKESQGMPSSIVVSIAAVVKLHPCNILFGGDQDR